jgi:hypothetical protein
VQVPAKRDVKPMLHELAQSNQGIWRAVDIRSSVAYRAHRPDTPVPGGRSPVHRHVDLIRAREETGHALPSEHRGRLEHALGTYLGDVRVHTGSRAARVADDLSARAFTVNKDIFFAHGTYAPQSFEGQRLIAHEVAHTVQPQAASAAGTLMVSSPRESAEVAAETFAAQVVGDAPGTASTAAEVFRSPRAAVTRATIAEMVFDGNCEDALIALRGHSMTGVLGQLSALGSDLNTLANNGGSEIERVDFAIQVISERRLPFEHPHAQFLVSGGYFDQFVEVWQYLGVGVAQQVREAADANIPAVVAFLLDTRPMSDLLDLLVMVRGQDYLAKLGGGPTRRELAVATVDAAKVDAVDPALLAQLTDEDQAALRAFSDRWRFATEWTLSPKGERQLRADEGPHVRFSTGANNECTLGGLFISKEPCPKDLEGQLFDPAKHGHLIKKGRNPEAEFKKRVGDAMKIVQDDVKCLLTQGQFDSLINFTFNRNKGTFYGEDDKGNPGLGPPGAIKQALDEGRYDNVPGAMGKEAPLKDLRLKPRFDRLQEEFQQNTPVPPQ